MRKVTYNKKKASKKRKVILLYFTLITSCIYLTWRLLFTLPFMYGKVSLTIGAILLICEILTVIETFTHFINTSHVRLPNLPTLKNENYPTVDILICTHNENVGLLYKTINGCVNIDYPDQKKVKIHLCDDGNRPEMKELANDFGINYHALRGNKYAKAGNLNNALFKTNGEYVAVFDADMVPTRNFLLETIPYFFEDNQRNEIKSNNNSIGYVQTRQSFYNLDIFQRNLYLENHITNEQDYFYREVNPSRMATNSAAFAGSNVVFDRKVLLEINGFATHSITEDLATSIEIEGRGYRGIALDKELAHGLCPEDVKSYIIQRKRWSRGAAQAIITKKFWLSKLTLKSKFNYFIAYLYWWTFFRRFVFIACPILFSVFGIVIADASLISLLIMWLPHYIFYNYAMKIMSDNTINTTLSSIQDTVQFPYLLSPIFLGTIHIPENKFEVTSKEKIKEKNSSFKLALPFIFLLVLSIIGIFSSIYRIVFDFHEGSVIVLFWLLYNLLPLVNGILFYYGRDVDSENELLKINTPIAINDEGEEIRGETLSMNESKIIFSLDEINYEIDKRLIEYKVEYKDYTFKNTGVVKYDNNSYEVCVNLDAVKRTYKDRFLHILYDRPHTLTRKTNLTYIEDIDLLSSIIFKKRTSNKKTEEKAAGNLEL